MMKPGFSMFNVFCVFTALCPNHHLSVLQPDHKSNSHDAGQRLYQNIDAYSYIQDKAVLQSEGPRCITESHFHEWLKELSNKGFCFQELNSQTVKFFKYKCLENYQLAS